MANTLAYAELFQTTLDEVLIADSLTSWMTENASQVIYNGGNKYKVPKIDMDDIEDYNRTTGFVNGSVTLEYEEKTFEKDWGKSFSIDAMDVDETNYVATVSNVLAQFVRTKVVPKVDSYRLTKLASEAGHKVTYTVDKSSVYSKIKADLDTICGETGVDEEKVVIQISRSAFNALCASTELQKTLQVNGAAADLNSKVKTVNGATLIVTPDSRMGAGVNWIMALRTAPVAIAKHEKVRQFSPDVNQNADAYKVDYRLYHTLNVNDNKKVAVLVSTNA